MLISKAEHSVLDFNDHLSMKSDTFILDTGAIYFLQEIGAETVTTVMIM